MSEPPNRRKHSLNIYKTMKAVIPAGGKGTRLGKITQKIPKPMIKIGGLTLLEHQINLLKRYGIKDILILTGHLSEVIENYFKDGKQFGVKISYFRENEPLGSAGGLKEIENLLPKMFLVLFGDIMLDVNLRKLINFHKKKGGVGTLVLHPNDHPYDSDLIEINKDKKVIALHSKSRPANRYFHNLANTGISVVSKKILKYIKSGVKTDLEKDIFAKIFQQKNIFGYITAEHIKDIGTPQRLKEVRNDFLNGKFRRLNIDNKRKAIFLDRDGVINYDMGNLSEIKKFRLLPNVGRAIKLINSSEYLAIIATNQPMIAKGMLTFNELDNIHKKMETLLGSERAKLDAIYFCPHHPEKGFKGEVEELKVKCDCRKPATGMFLRAKRDFNIDLKNSWMIGDSERDIGAGVNAKMKTVLVKKNQEFFQKIPYKTKRTNNLLSAVKLIVETKK